MDGLTDRQLEVLRFIAREIEERGYTWAPSARPRVPR